MTQETPVAEGRCGEQQPLIVFVSKSAADDRALREIAGQITSVIVSVPDIDSAREAIGMLGPRLVVCDADGQCSGGWRELLPVNGEYSLLVVSSRPTESLWAEVLNLGGFDLLGLPFGREGLKLAIRSALR
jgi:hypothetical protein